MSEQHKDSGDRLTVAEALELVSPFFEKEWPSTKAEDAQVRRVTGGFCHSLHLISRSTAALQEPGSVLIRHFGPSGDEEEPLQSNTTLSAAEQAVVYYEMGRRGWGPKVYGFFRGGRLEEYLDSHPLTAAESTKPEIRRDVARSYSRLHSLQLPFRKCTFALAVREFKSVEERNAEIAQKLVAVASPDSTELAGFISNTDWCDELDWLSILFEKNECRKTLAVGDTNFLNILVKDYESECRVMLIDYETVAYSYRGIDIGGHFSDRMYCWSHPENVLTGYPLPDFEEQSLFCESYLQEMRDLGQELTANDTVAHLLLESEIGQMYQMLFSFLMCMMFGELQSSSSLVAGLNHMSKVYCQLKCNFLSRYGTADQEAKDRTRY